MANFEELDDTGNASTKLFQMGPLGEPLLSTALRCL